MIESAPNDEQLVAAVCRGDTAAAHELYERYGPAVLRFARAMLRSRGLAEDIVHDTFLHFLSRPDRYRPERGPLIAYLLGMARILARRSPADAEPPRDAIPGLASESDEPVDPVEEHAARSELVRQVRAAVLELPWQHREVVTLCDLQELPYATVAAVLDCPLGTIRSRLHRARALLAARLAGSTIPGGSGVVSAL